MDLAGFRCGPMTLWTIEESNYESVRDRLAATVGSDWIVDELDNNYRPRYGEDGRREIWGFVAEQDGVLAGMSLLGVGSYHDARGFTGADTLVHMRGRGATPYSKPALFYLGFEILGLNRIETGCLASNDSSRRSIEKTPGFEFEGVLREYSRNEQGEFEDERRYSILRRDWERLYRTEDVQVLTRQI